MVAIGDGKDVPWLQQMAELGNGRFHLTLKPQTCRRSLRRRRPPSSVPIWWKNASSQALVSESPIVANIRQVPALYGYVGTSAKVTAQVVLETPQGDPLLATWQYGLGRAVAWTSDATGRWAADWVRWTGFPTFWAQTVAWSITQGRDSSVESLVAYERVQRV
jgi:hypothetical protein